MRKTTITCIVAIVTAMVFMSCPSPIQPRQDPTPAATPAPTPTPDTNPPALSSASAPTTIRDNQSFNVSVTAIDPEHSILTVELYDGATLLCPLGLTAQDSYAANYSGFKTEQTYSNLNIKAKDVAGNEASLSLPSLYIQSTNSYLASLTVSPGTLSPGFSPATTYYTMTVASGTKVNMTATRATKKAAITTSTSKSGSIATATVVVTAEAGAPYTTTYTVVVTFK